MYTPSAYTLTNTTRPHELNAKNPRRRFFRRMGRGKIGILAKERTVHNCTNDRKITNHRQKHTLKAKRRDKEEARSAPRHPTIEAVPTNPSPNRIGPTDASRSRQITLHDEIKVALVLERATPRAHTRLHTRVVR